MRFAIEHYYHLLRDAEDDFNVAAARTAQYDYMWGTFLGVVVLGVWSLAVAAMLWSGQIAVSDERVSTAFGCAIAGAFGAAASVSWRVTIGEFLLVDPGAGVATLRRLGSVRPWIGAIFGLALYFGLKSGFINLGEGTLNSYFFVFLAFIAGFSERAIPELLRTAEQRLGGTPPPPRQDASRPRQRPRL